jgi:hypothetical protein
VRRGVDALDLAAQAQVEVGSLQREQRELDAGGTSVEDRDGVRHGTSRGEVRTT